ncbi:MAG: hypothetical protein WCD20_19660 [Rhodomicrobium sp.]
MTKFTFLALSLAGAILALTQGHPARADTEQEKQKLAQCAKDICGILVSKDAKGPGVTCDLTKTWDKDVIQKGAESKSVGWGLGSATCSAKVTIKRADIVAAMTASEMKFRFSKQPFSCEIGTDKYPVSATLAPVLRFKGGTVVGASLRMDDIQGAALIKGVVWTASELERHLGIFEGDLVREINRFVQKECPKILSATK